MCKSQRESRERIVTEKMRKREGDRNAREREREREEMRNWALKQKIRNVKNICKK